METASLLPMSQGQSCLGLHLFLEAFIVWVGPEVAQGETGEESWEPLSKL